MTQLMQSGMIADIVIGVMIVEGLLLLALRSRWRNFRTTDVVGMLAAGLFLVLALRATLTGAGWPWVAIFLTAAFVAHGLDLWRQLHQRQ
jgi:hypothetical protein